MPKVRIHPESGQRQIKIQPEGLPAIWVEADAGLCERCRPYDECLNFNGISDKVWDELNNLLSFSNKVPIVANS